MQAIILAAGMGKRLKELTQHNTKCMVEVNGVSLISRMLHQIDALNLSRIVIVTGHEGEKLKEHIAVLEIKTEIIFIDNPIFDKTNNIYSLSLAKDWLIQEDTLIFESDLIFEDDVIKTLINDSRESLMLVDKYESWMNGTCVKLNENDEIAEFISEKNFDFRETDKYYKTVNIYKFSSRFSKTSYVPFLDAYLSVLGQNEYYEQVLRVITMLDKVSIQAKRLNGQKWYEIDDLQDLDIASTVFLAGPENKAGVISQRYGGYWRYPKLIDFSYLVNPYFPPQKMTDEITSNAQCLITQYPSGMRVNCLLASDNFGIREENIIVGNGASELIKTLIERLSGKTGIIRPTFEEYVRRCPENDVVCFTPCSEDFSYTAEDVIEFFDDKKIDNLIIVNPDNPTGNYIDKRGIINILEWSARNNIKIIVDESFADFSEEENAAVLRQDILDFYNNLYVIKSISKSYGVPGLRLGVMASADVNTVSLMKMHSPIWNINSFAEFFMQILPKYENDYRSALNKFRKERRCFASKLGQVNGVRVFPSQANFVMLELGRNYSAKKIQARLLDEYNILVKDLSDKIALDGRELIRVAVKTTDENDKLIAALEKELGNNI